MLHGVVIDRIDTLEEYGLILLADLSEGEAEPKTELLDIPGGYGSLDLSDSPQGRPVYKMRDISFTLFRAVDSTALEELRAALARRWHGREVTLQLPTDAGHYYRGRIRIGSTSGYNSGKIPISMRAQPWKLKNTVTTVSVAVTEGRTVYLENECMPVSPSVSASAPVTISWGTNSVSIDAGENWSIPALILESGITELTITGTATVSFTYQEGCL